jgi:co-chaperonin GroES (HSP10)
MPLAHALKVSAISLADDPKLAIKKAAGDLADVEVYSGWILLGTYIRPVKTAGGIIRPDTNVEEDEFQGKVGLVLKKGPLAFVDDENNSFAGQDAEIGDWVVYTINDTRALTINGAPCRLIQDTKVIMRVKDPKVIF